MMPIKRARRRASIVPCRVLITQPRAGIESNPFVKSPAERFALLTLVSDMVNEPIDNFQPGGLKSPRTARCEAAHDKN
jgi:hypothetical protein